MENKDKNTKKNKKNSKEKCQKNMKGDKNPFCLSHHKDKGITENIMNFRKLYLKGGQHYGRIYGKKRSLWIKRQ
jgi:hypothetical protein